MLGELSGERPLAAWTATLTTALELLTDTTATEAWQAVQARAELAEAAHVAGPHAASVPLGLADVRSLLAERLRGRPTRAGFRTGTLTVATLVPMRSVPHRVVCLLGLDDGVFPRAGEVDGDDVLARRPLVGERDARSEDRQLLLDAIMAATDTLVVVHSGADERTGLRRPPAVPLGELLDASPPAHRPTSSSAIRCSRSTPATSPPRSASTAPSWPGRARPPGRGPRRRRSCPPRSPGPRPAPCCSTSWSPSSSIRSRDSSPSVSACRCTRATRRPPTRCRSRPTASPNGRSATGCWATGSRAASSTTAGRPSGAAATCRRARWAIGCSPTVLEDVEPLVAAAAEYRVGEAADRDVDVELPDGTRVVGTVGGLHGHTALRVEYSRLTPKQRMRSWVRLVALTAATDEPWRAVTVGRGERFGIARADRRAGRRRTRPARCWPSWWRCGRRGCARRCR